MTKSWPKKGYFIYCLLEGGKSVRYIGATSQPSEKRLNQHMEGRGYSHKSNWVNRCKKEGIPVTIKLMGKSMTLQRALLIERLLIAMLRKPFRLVNCSMGGEPGRWFSKPRTNGNNRVPAKMEQSDHPLPEYGTILYTILVEDAVTGLCEKYEIHQGARRNSIEPRIFGQPFIKSITCGFDELFRSLRKRWSLRWLILN